MNSVPEIVTVFRSAERESEIAAIVIHFGWRLIRRTFSLESINKVGDDSSTIYLVDESLVKQASPNNFTSHIIEVSDAMSASDIFTRVTSQSDSHMISQSRSLSFQSKSVIAFGSLMRASGTSTLSFECASLLQETGAKMLFIDAHPQNPFIAPHLNLHGIHTRSQFVGGGVEIVEFDPKSSESVETCQDSINRAERVVVDLGDVRSLSARVRGKRLQDLAVAAFAQSISHLIVVEDGRRNSNELFEEFGIDNARLTYCKHIERVVNFSTLREYKDRKSGYIGYFLEDSRAVQAAREKHTYISALTHRTMIGREMKRMINESLNV